MASLSTVREVKSLFDLNRKNHSRILNVGLFSESFHFLDTFLLALSMRNSYFNIFLFISMAFDKNLDTLRQQQQQ